MALSRYSTSRPLIIQQMLRLKRQTYCSTGNCYIETQTHPDRRRRVEVGVCPNERRRQRGKACKGQGHAATRSTVCRGHHFRRVTDHSLESHESRVWSDLRIEHSVKCILPEVQHTRECQVAGFVSDGCESPCKRRGAKCRHGHCLAAA